MVFDKYLHADKIPKNPPFSFLYIVQNVWNSEYQNDCTQCCFIILYLLYNVYG